MKKRYMDVCMGLMMILMMCVLAGQGIDTVKETTAVPEKATHLVVIDSGHGGIDPGKVGVNQALEKDINLAIAQKLEEKLTDSGIRVIMTRIDDEGLYPESATNKKVADLDERCRIIQESKAEIAVSIHQNSYHSEEIMGPQVFYFKNSIEGERLAHNLEEEFASISDHTRNSKSNDSYYLLRNVSCPVVIAECGFLSNWEEAQLLTTEEYQDQIAEALSAGILRYLEGDTSSL